MNRVLGCCMCMVYKGGLVRCTLLVLVVLVEEEVEKEVEEMVEGVLEGVALEEVVEDDYQYDEMAEGA